MWSNFWDIAILKLDISEIYGGPKKCVARPSAEVDNKATSGFI